MANEDKVSEGLIPFVVDGETHHTWYKVLGDLTDRSKTPLVVLHGGPGISHDNLLPIGDLAHTHSIPVIFYDQLGNGRSTHLREKPTAFWTVDLFIEELANLIDHLGIQDRFDILGHSWGGMLGVEFEIRRQPAGLRRLVLANSLASMALWVQSNIQLMQTFPEDVQEGLKVQYADIPRYRAALAQLHAKHGCRIQPFPKEFVYSLDQVFGADGDPTVSIAMFEGEIKEWSVLDKLHTVRVPTLVINGRWDVAQDFVCAPFFRDIRQVKWITFDASSHCPHWEEREKYMQVVGGFLEM